MSELFGITKDELMDASKIKIIDGIAGSGKSTTIVNFLKDYGFKYFTPTNRLAKSSSERFDIKAQTTASGLFKTIGGKFYAAERPMEGENVIIDELLLTSPEVWSYISNNANNYFLLTDSRQMLPPHCNTIKIAQEELKKRDYIYKRVSETKRAINSRTIDDYNRFYKAAGNDCKYPLNKLLNEYPVIDFRNMEYLPENTYIVHTNVEEKRLYQMFRQDIIERMPKALSAKETDGEKIDALPMMCQTDAISTKAKNYSQAANIATPTRFQGCETGGKLFYIINENSAITTRELYTTITRLKNVENLTIVVDGRTEDKFEFFMGKRVKKEGFITLKAEETVADVSCAVRCLAAQKSKKSNSIHFSTELYFVEGDKKIHKVDNIKAEPKEMHTPDQITEREKEEGKRRITCKSLLAKEDGICLGAEAVKEVYRILEKHGVDRIKRPTIMNFGNKLMNKSNFDFYSAFPHILYYDRFPIEGRIYKEYRSDKMNFFLNTCDNILNAGSIVTEDVLDRMGEKVREKFVFLFGTDWKQGTRMGEKVLEKSLRSIDSKAAVKEIHWGFLLTPFIKKDNENGSEIYITNQNAVYELFGIALYSHMIAIMLDIIKAGKLKSFNVVIDGIFYDGDEDTDKAIIEYIKSTPYRGRLYHGHYENKDYIKDSMVWKNYEELTKKRKKITL